MSGINAVSGAHTSNKGNLVVEHKDGSQDVLTKDGRTIHQNAPASKDTYRPTPPSTSRPTPPSTGGTYRPTPPSTQDNYRPTPPSVNNGYDRPVPPEVHVPRYYWQPTFPVVLPNNPQTIPHIALPPSPAPARRVDMAEVSNDPVELLAGYGRLRDTKKTLFVTTHPELSASEAKAKLGAGQTIQLAADSGAHISKDAYKPITSASQLDPLLPAVKSQKLGDLQAGENRAAQNRVNQWVDTDVSRRMDALPAFNSVYDMNRLNMSNFMVTEGGRNFNRNMVTAMNIYNQGDVRREIATKWHDNPDMSTSEFNRMANGVVGNHVANLFWQADYQGDWGTYLGSNPVPGLRYPDTQEDIDYNANVIRQTTSTLPMLLNSSVNN